MKKKSIFFISLAVICATILFVSFENKQSTTASSVQKEHKEFGQFIKSLGQNQNTIFENDENVLLDKKEYKQLIKYFEVIMDKSNPEAKSLALAQIVEEGAIIQKAKELNVSPSIKEIKERVKVEREKFESADPNDYQTIQVNLMLESLIEGLGITEEQYWNDYIISGYLYTISQENLYSHITKDTKDEQTAKKVWETFKIETIDDFSKKHQAKIEELEISESKN